MPPCVVADMMSSMKGFDNDAIRTAIKEVAAIAFGGIRVERFCSLKLLTCLLLLSGSVADETVSTTALSCNFHNSYSMASPQTSDTLLVFLLAMVLHPDIQTKAQADIDRVVGRDRLPDFNDRSALPYVDAILRETLRWYPVVPLGL